MGGKGRVFGWRVLMFGLALLALLSFSVGKVAECAVAVGTGSHRAADLAAGPAHSESAHSHRESALSESVSVGPAGAGSAVQPCHHDAGHQHKGAANKVYASLARVVDHVSVPVDPDATDLSAAGALVLLGLGRRGPPSSVPRSSPSGRHILISGCVART